MTLTYPSKTEVSPLGSHEERRWHFYARGEIISLISNGLWQVSHGLVQLSTISDHGEEILLGWAQAKDFFGQYLTNLEVYEAKALSDVYLRWYSPAEIENSPTLGHILLNQVLRRVRQTETLLAIAGIRKVEEKLQQLLFFLKKDLGEPAEQGVRLPVRFTHQNLASTINTTRVTVTRLLGEFQRQGWILLDSDRHLIILDV